MRSVPVQSDSIPVRMKGSEMYKGTATMERRKVSPLYRHKRGPTTVMQHTISNGDSQNQGVAMLAVLLTTGVVWGLLDGYPDTPLSEGPGPQYEALQNLEMRRLKDRTRLRERRAKEAELWKALRELFPEATSRYDLLHKVARSQGISVPQREPPSKKWAPVGVMRGETRRMKKNEGGREDSRRMRATLDAIAEFYGMRRMTTDEILTKLVDESERS